MSKYHRVIGIDLGTTYSVVAVYNFDKSDVVVIPNAKSHNERTTPSVVYVSPQGEVTVGRNAKKKLETDPKGVLFEVKRIMGERNDDGSKKMAVTGGGRALDPELVSAYVLKALKASAEQFIGEPVHDAVITVPAYFKEPQKNATKEAARIAGLNVHQIVNEPTAAAIAYATESEEVQTFLVYDFGGGTFDVSLVRMESQLSGDVLGTGGDAHLGGGDIDAEIVKWVLRKMQEEHGRDFSSDTKLMGRLRVEAERTKIAVCAQGSAVEFELANPTPQIDNIVYELSVAEFERMAKPYIDRTLAQVDVALESARKKHGVTIEDVSAIVLVGGSSKLPVVSRALKDRFNKPLKSDLNADEIVALGAARLAKSYPATLGVDLRDDAKPEIDRSALRDEQLESNAFRDVVSHTLGVGLVDDVYDPLIQKDQFIPHKVVRAGYTTARDNQTSIYVPIYQGDNPKASKNQQIGQVKIDPITPEPKGHHQFEIAFALDENGIFDGHVKHLQTNVTKKAELDRGHGQITEKKRIDLAAQVASGKIAAVPPSDPVDKMVLRASEVLATLPPSKQREVSDLLVKLASARAGGDERTKAEALRQLTALLYQAEN